MANSVSIALLFIFSIPSFSASAQLLKTLSSPVVANTVLPLFTFTLNNNEQYFIHIGGPFLVRRCDDGVDRPTVSCSSLTCIRSKRFSPEMCPVPDNAVVNGSCACQGTAFDPITAQCNSNQFSNGNFVISSTVINNVYYLCAPPPFVADFPPGVFGVAGLSPSTVSTWSQFTQFPSKKFAFCLPSDDSDKGAIFFGRRGPLTSIFLTYTPFVRNSKRLNGYFLGLRGISVNRKEIAVGTNAFGFDSNGDGGVMLSTVNPYSVLRSDVYTAFVNEFSNATKTIPRAVNVAPFRLCFQTGSVGSGQAGFNVPRIDLKFGLLSTWTFYGENSMKKVNADVACLAFLDGGANATQAVVIGTHQMKNNLLEFNMGLRKFGFSSSLSLIKSSCSQFQA